MARGGRAILLVTTAVACAAHSGTGGLSCEGLFNPITGKYTQEFSASLDQTYEATLEATKVFEFTAMRYTNDRLGAAVVARRADGTEVALTLRPAGRYWTKVTIGVGWGDERASVQIAQELERRLQLMRR
jgi:hypothetical protein